MLLNVVILVESKLDGFCADGTGATTWLVFDSDPPKSVLFLSKYVVALALEFVTSTIECGDMAVTISAALGFALLILARPKRRQAGA